jgi:hypothetical protein
MIVSFSHLNAIQLFFEDAFKAASPSVSLNFLYVLDQVVVIDNRVIVIIWVQQLDHLLFEVIVESVNFCAKDPKHTMCSLINSDMINDSLRRSMNDSICSTHGNISPWLALFNEKLSNDRGLNMPGSGGMT